MEEVDKIIALSLDNYFSTLMLTGYVNQDNVNALILLIEIQYILDNFYEYITDADLKTLVNALYCAGNYCLIPYPETTQGTLFFNDYVNNIKKYITARIAESGEFRDTENNEIRITEIPTAL